MKRWALCALLSWLVSAGCKSTGGEMVDSAAVVPAPEVVEHDVIQVSHAVPADAEQVEHGPSTTQIERLPPLAHERGASIAPLALDEAVAAGLRDNPRLRQMAADTLGARADVDVAYAPFLPEAGTSFRYSSFSTEVLPGGSFVPASLSSGVNSFVLAEIGVHYTIADFGRRAGQYGAAVHRARSRELAWSRARQTVAYEVVQSYLQLLSAREVLEVRQEAMRDAERILEDTRARLEGGVVEREAVLRAEVELSMSKQFLIGAYQGVHDAAATLNVVMGRSPTAPLEIAEVLACPTFDRSLEDCLGEAVVARREIGMAREAVAEAQHGVQEARGERLPKVYVRGTAVRADSDGPLNGFVEGVGIHVDQPLYAGGRYRGEIRHSQAQVSAALAGLQVIADNVSLQVSLAFQAIETNSQRIALAESAVAQARENLRLTEVRYENGDATPTDVVDAQTALVESRTSYYTAIFGYLEGLSRLEYALGNDQTRLLEQMRSGPASAEQL